MVQCGLGVGLIPDRAFEVLASGMGIKAIRVEDPHKLEAAMREVLAHKGPALLDVVSARQELVMPPKAMSLLL